MRLKYIYAIMKTICSPNYHCNDFVETHALGHKIYGYTLLVPMKKRVLNKMKVSIIEYWMVGYKMCELIF